MMHHNLKSLKPFNKPIHNKSPFLLLFLLLMLSSFLLLLLLFPPSPSLSSTPTPPLSLIHQACQSSLSPPQCVSSFPTSSLPANPSPSDLILSLISLSAQNLQPPLSLLNSSLSSSNPARENANENCISHLSLSSRRLSAASQSLTADNAADARAHLSAALLYQYDCWSALRYVNTTARVGSLMAFLEAQLIAVSSDALAMLSALQRFGPDGLSLWKPPQTERDGYWPTTPNDAPETEVDYSFPELSVASATVCKEGCGFSTIQAAVDSAPDFGPARFVVYIKEGVYEETVKVRFEKTNVVFVGDGMGKTVITGKTNAQMVGVTTYNTATVGVVGDGFMARDLTVENSAGPNGLKKMDLREEEMVVRWGYGE